ncbi:unnamed protein product [Paramecium primaurelia]|uniref:Uncharacterized protein n=1 Tax=Paramecium primaurelia TaxID=5886 RepID=A0A8S1KKU1_PARPR|nr:unnamed protein product [Paramecium primaurelia]
MMLMNTFSIYHKNIGNSKESEYQIYYQELKISTQKNGSKSIIFIKLNNKNQELIIKLQSIEHIKNYIEFQLIVLLILKN